MPITIIAGNWKMNTSADEAVQLATSIKAKVDDVQEVEKVLCPPFVWLSAVGRAIEGTSLKLGAQNLYYEEKGAYTGEISPAMLGSLCQYAILGHSERRHIFGEEDALINKKVIAALKTHLRPILCVGERLEEREAGRAEVVVETQLRAGLSGVTSPTNLCIAYEPVWAIGTGQAATAEMAQAIMAHARRILSSAYGEALAREIPLLYGGSVTPDNISEFMGQPDVNGALVGGASLNADSFAGIVTQAAQARR